MDLQDYVNKALEMGFKDSVGSVYVILNDNGYCKVGSSKEPQTRVRNIKTQGGIITDMHYISIPILGRTNVEFRVHDKLSSLRCIGEWFNIQFDECVSTVKETIINSTDLYERELARMQEYYRTKDERLDALKKAVTDTWHTEHEVNHSVPWYNWVRYTQHKPENTFKKILSVSMELRHTSLLMWSGKSEKWISCETGEIHDLKIDLWMPVIDPYFDPEFGTL